MKSFRIVFLLVLLGSYNGPILAQDSGNKLSLGVTLGRPSAEAAQSPSEPIRFMSSFVPIRPSSPRTPPPSVVRGARPILEDEPRTPIVPRDLTVSRERDIPLSGGQRNIPLPAGKDSGVTTEAVQIVPPGAVKEKPELLQAPVRILSPYEIESTAAPEILSEEDARSFLFASSDPVFYARGEYLLWWARGFHIPPLVTTASANDPADTRGTLGMGTTRLLYGDSTVLQGLRSGGRFTFGWNCDPCGIYGIEASFFFLANQSDSASFDSSNFPVIGRPFYFANINQPSRELTTTPEFSTGNLQVNMSTSLFGAEINKRALLWCGCDYKLTGILGFRYLNLHDQLGIQESTSFVNDVPAPNPLAAPIFSKGDHSFVFDSFNTRNQFYGGQIGLDYTRRRNRVTFDGFVKLGLGVTQQSIDIDGGQRITKANGSVQNYVGGLYAVNSNIGHFSQTRFGIVPEIGFRIGYDLTSNVRIFAGYNFLYWSSVVRPGDQIDQTIDVNRVPNSGGPFPPANQVRPTVPFATTSYWAQGVTAGVEIRY